MRKDDDDLIPVLHRDDAHVFGSFRMNYSVCCVSHNDPYKLVHWIIRNAEVGTEISIPSYEKWNADTLTQAFYYNCTSRIEASSAW